jgi:hypothetical protein
LPSAARCSDILIVVVVKSGQKLAYLGFDLGALLADRGGATDGIANRSRSASPITFAIYRA